MPHLGIAARRVETDLVRAQQTIVSRTLAPSNNVVVSMTEFVTDGKRNALPGHAAPLHASDFDFNDDALTLGTTFRVGLVQQQLALQDTSHV